MQRKQCLKDCNTGRDNSNLKFLTHVIIIVFKSYNQWNWWHSFYVRINILILIDTRRYNSKVFPCLTGFVLETDLRNWIFTTNTMYETAKTYSEALHYFLRGCVVWSFTCRVSCFANQNCDFVLFLMPLKKNLVGQLAKYFHNSN